MPGKARREKMNPLEVETHHTWSRCVGRAYLLGVDPLTGIDYSHRREWLESAIEYFTSVFAVDLGTYHWLSNHMHNVVRNRPDIAETWSDEEVAWRWKRAFPRFEDGRWVRVPTDDDISDMLQREKEREGYIDDRRCRLANISWYQGLLKQSIAFIANRESDKRGHFWEQRFGNRKLETEDEVVTGFLYNDLQQVRAGVVDSVEESDYSAIQRQIKSQARQAFTDVYGREPEGRSDEDCEQVEQLEALFANCFLSPIEGGGRLLTNDLDDEIPPSELVLPQGYLYEQTASPDEAGGNEAGNSEADAPTGHEPAGNDADIHDADSAGIHDAGTERNGERVTDEPGCSSAAEQTTRRGPGRPRRERRYTFHNQFRQQQRRRPSRSSILGIPWSEYYDWLKQIERLVLEKRRQTPVSAEPPPETAGGGRAERGNRPDTPEPPPGAVPDNCSPTNWMHSVREFTAWLMSVADELPESLAAHLSPSPRGDPPAT